MGPNARVGSLPFSRRLYRVLPRRATDPAARRRRVSAMRSPEGASAEIHRGSKEERVAPGGGAAWPAERAAWPAERAAWPAERAAWPAERAALPAIPPAAFIIAFLVAALAFPTALRAEILSVRAPDLPEGTSWP